MQKTPPGMFSAGDAYERFMGRWSRKLAPALVQFAGVRDGDSVLDVGCGTGALAAAAAAIGPSVQVSGVDPSAAYVTAAARRHGTDRVRFRVGDARELPFPAASFDRTLSLLILNFVPEPGAAVDQMIRVTRPGGTVAAAVWDYAGGMEMLRTFWDEAIALRPEMDSRDERHMRFSTAGELAALWRARGLRDVVETSLVIEMPFASFDDYWQPFLAGQGPAGVFIAALPDAAREQLRERLAHRLTGTTTGATISMQGRAWAVRGEVVG